MITLVLIAFGALILLGMVARNPLEALLFLAAVLFAYHQYGGGQ